MVSRFIMDLTKERAGTHRLWEKMEDEGVDKNFKSSNGREMELVF